MSPLHPLVFLFVLAPTAVLARCYHLTAECTVEASVYGYLPNLGANSFFAVVFAILALIQIIEFVRWKTWSFGIVVTIGCIFETIGYIGRILMYHNPYGSPFSLQITFIIISPTFMCAGLYLTLKHIIRTIAPRLSRLRPQLITWSFISADILSLLLQAGGGAIEATAQSSGDSHRLKVGNDMMMVGIAFQVVTLTLFFLLGADFFRRVMYTCKDMVSPGAHAIVSDHKFRYFVCGILIAFTGIYIRCIYRIVEMAGGWRNPVMQDQVSFIILEGIMILSAATALDLFHPGNLFPPMRSGYSRQGHIGIIAPEQPLHLQDRECK